MKTTNTMSVNALFDVLTEGLNTSEIKATMVTSEISSTIVDERIKLNMTQKEFADFMNVSQAMVSKWESGSYNFTISSIANIFDKLGLDFNFSVISDEEWEAVHHQKSNIVFSFIPPAPYQNKADNLCTSA